MASVAVDKLVRAWVFKRLPAEFLRGASLITLSRRYGLTTSAVAAVIRRYCNRSRVKR